MTFVLFLRLIIFFLSNWGIKGTNEQHCSVPTPPPSLSQFSPAPSRQFHFVQYTLKILFLSCETTCSYNGGIGLLKACTLYTVCPRGLNDQEKNVMGRFRRKGRKVNLTSKYTNKLNASLPDESRGQFGTGIITYPDGSI